MTVKDLLKRLTMKDLDKMVLWSDGKAWSNIDVRTDGVHIYIHPDKQCSPFSSDNE